MHDFDEVVDRRNTASEKWEKYRDRDIIPMWVADMDFRSPPVVLEALRRRTEHGVFGYTGASSELIDAVMQVLERDYGWRIDPQWIVWLPGLVAGL
ncbi:partial Cystathionine beta-lyase PatB, partial [Anaerolineae bacterium]